MAYIADDNVGFWLFYAQLSSSYVFAEYLKACCQEHHKAYIVTPPQWGVLALLDEHDGITPGFISQKRGVDAPTITGVVKRLEQNGLVERRHDYADRRQVKVFLTEEGRDIMRYLPAAAEAYLEVMTHGFADDEVVDLQAKLRRIISNLSTHTPGASNRFNLVADRSWYVAEEDQPEV